MLVENLLLPRFLILELVLVCHYFQFTKACNSILVSRSETEAGVCKDEDEECEGSPCFISLDKVGWTHQPLLYSQQREWLWPDAGRVVKLRPRSRVVLSCPGSAVNTSSVPDPSLTAELTCDGARFVHDGSEVDLSAYGCDRNPRDEERRAGSGCGPEQDGDLVEIGFTVDTSFHPVLSVCHSGAGETTHYTRHTLHGATVASNNVEEGRPSFKEGKLFFKGVSADTAYGRRSQRAVLSRLLGSESGAVTENGNYLARGHLAPDADFLYKDWQEATYYYANAAPQWQTVNNGNWRALEAAVRDKARRAGTDLEIYTGTLGILQLPAENGTNQEVWLATNKDKKFIPVPEYFFKIVTDVAREESMAVLCTNNPLLPAPSLNLRSNPYQPPCTDICDQTGWGDKLKDRNKVEAGILVCCTPEEFSALVPWAGPVNLPAHSILRL